MEQKEEQKTLNRIKFSRQFRSVNNSSVIGIPPELKQGLGWNHGDELEMYVDEKSKGPFLVLYKKED